MSDGTDSFTRKSAPSSSDLLGAAETAVRAAGDILLELYESPRRIRARNLRDVKLEADHQSQDAVLKALRKVFPDHGIISEECEEQPTRSGYTWVIDPLDGSVNFLHGIPHFCVSVACYGSDDNPEPGGEHTLAAPLAGAVFAPVTGEIFLGIPGRSPLLNQRPLALGDSPPLSDSVVSCSFGKTRSSIRRMALLSGELALRARKVRLLGSTALELAYIASGRLGGLVQPSVGIWDFAAGRIVLEGAGGLFECRPAGRGLWCILAAAPGTYQGLTDTLILVSKDSRRNASS
jgi:myo-inositol-1(or 4)-monophosphatase